MARAGPYHQEVEARALPASAATENHHGGCFRIYRPSSMRPHPRSATPIDPQRRLRDLRLAAGVSSVPPSL
jgi:hypothetical protein